MLKLMMMHFENNDENIQNKINNLIDEKNIIRDDNPIFKENVLRIRKSLSSNLLKLKELINQTKRNNPELNLQIDVLLGLLYKISPAEYIDTFSNYIITNNILTPARNNSYTKCLNSMLEVTLSTGNETLGRKIIEKGSEYYSKVELRHFNPIINRAHRRFGKNNSKWIAKYFK